MNVADLSRPTVTRRTGYVLMVALSVLLIALMVALALMLRKPRPQSFPGGAGMQVVRVLYGPGVGPKPFFKRPMSAAFSYDGRIYAADTGNNRIVVFDAEGRFLFDFGELGVAKPAKGGTYSWAPGRFNYPTDIAIDSSGTVYVADFRNDQIQVFDRAGRFIRAFPDRNRLIGKGGSGQGGRGIGVTSVAVQDGRVYATDRYQVFVFTTTGKLIKQFGRPGSGTKELDHPNGVAVGPDANIAVSDSDNNRVVAFSPAGRQIWQVGGRFGAESTAQSHGIEVPRGMAMRDDGTLMVVDAMAGNVLEISPQGEVVNTLGKYGESPGEFNLPTDVDSMGNRIVVTEKGGDRVQILALDR